MNYSSVTECANIHFPCIFQQVCTCEVQHALAPHPPGPRWEGKLRLTGSSGKLRRAEHSKVKVGEYKAYLPCMELPASLLSRNQNKLQSLILRSLVSKELA